MDACHKEILYSGLPLLKGFLCSRYLSTLTGFREEAYDTVGPFTSGLISFLLAWVVSLADHFLHLMKCFELSSSPF